MTTGKTLKKIHITLLSMPFMVVLGCNDIEKPDLFTSLFLNNGTNKIGIVSSDLGGAGHFSTMSTDGVPSFTSINIHSDAVARYSHNKVYVINRLGRDNIQVLNPNTYYLPELEFSTEPGSNPQDFIRLDDNHAYISRYNKTSILVVHPLTGFPVANIELLAFADSDGLPEMSGMHLEGTRLYVALQKLDRNHPFLILPPTANSTLIEIDTTSNTVVAQHIMPTTNPFGKLQKKVIFGQAHLIITAPAGIGTNHALDGGVVAFNLDTRTFRPGFLYHEITAGGDILGSQIKNQNLGYALVMFADYSMALQTFNPATGTHTGTVAWYPSSSGFVSDILLSQAGLLYVASATSNSSGITIYDTNNGNQLTPFPIEIGLRPTGLVEIP